MASKKVLDAELLELKNGVTQAFRMQLSYRRARYKVLVETYFWWRTASQKKGYLEDVFAREGIGYRTDLNRPNFKPFIKLVWGWKQDDRHKQQISNYGSAMNAVDDEYVRNQKLYTHDAVNELVAWIIDNGGTSGILGKKQEQTDEVGYTYKDWKKETKSKKVTKVDERKQKRQLEVLSLRKRAAGDGKKAQKLDIGEVGTGEDNFVVLLAKATGKGNELELVGTTAQQSIVDNALSNISDNNIFANAPASLRMLCEAIKLNTITRALRSYGARKNFYGKTTMAVKGDDKAVLRENARLVLCKDGTILVSKSSSDASLTTYYIPKTKIAVSEDIWLRGMDRFWLETELINESEIALYEATDLEQQKNAAIKATQQMTLKNTLSKQKRNIYFYDFSRVDDATMHQPTVDTKGITYDWTVKGTAAYFRRLYEQHFEGWQHRVKHRVHTANNKAVAFDVGKNGVVCEKKWDKGDLCFTQVGARYLTAFSDDADSKGKGRIVFAPTDIIATLQHIATSNVKGDIVMSGNEDVLFVNFNTDIAEVRVYIPSCSITGKRNAKCFKKFVANG